MLEVLYERMCCDRTMYCSNNCAVDLLCFHDGNFTMIVINVCHLSILILFLLPVFVCGTRFLLSDAPSTDFGTMFLSICRRIA